jgi:hypothetical protein
MGAHARGVPFFGRIAVCLLLGITFFPLIKAFTLGQIQA